MPWRHALEKTIKRQLSTGQRFSNFSELTASLGLSPKRRDSIKKLFFEFCLEHSVDNCVKARMLDHCKRSSIISALAICFNPIRGLSGYLKWVTEDGTPTSVLSLGSERTWRDHLTQVVKDTSCFSPAPVRLVARKSLRRPGRPPLQLVPTTSVIDMFDIFLKKPESLVCNDCRFS